MVYIGIGSNLGNRIKNIESAKIKLTEQGATILRSSSYYETFSWPNKNDPKFYNIVIKIITKLQYRIFSERSYSSSFVLQDF